MMAKRTVDIVVKQTAPIPLKVRLMGEATKVEQAADELIGIYILEVHGL